MVTLARGFAARGMKVDLVLARAEGPYLAEVPPEVRVVALKTRRVLYSLPGLVCYLRRERPVAMLSTLSHANIIALWARQIARVPMCLVVREATTVGISASNAPMLRGRWMPLLMRLFYRWADSVVAVSQGVAEDLIKNIKVPPEKVYVIYNPVVTPELLGKAEEPVEHPWFAPGEPPVILGCGRLTEAKDFPTLIRAFALVRKETPCRLVILGEGEERPKLEALVRELGLEEGVDLPGFVENPYKYMKRAQVFVLSSRWEGLPSTLIQALALGVPVVSTDCPSGPAEILEGGKWGQLVPVGDQRALAYAILASLSEARGLDSSKGREYLVDSKFGLNRVVSQYLGVLLERDSSHDLVDFA